jgi:hypothetical protein
MKRLQIDSFTNAGEDTETTKYKILGVLKEYQSNLRKNKLYPTLTELVSLSVSLDNMMIQTLEPNESSDDLYEDSEEDISIFGNLDTGVESTNDSDELIRWTRAQIYPILDEGIAVYEFVDENIDLQIINGASFYKDNGYLIVPEYKTSQFNIYSFHCILFNTDSAPIKSIKTLFVQSLPMNSSEYITAQFQTLVNTIGNKNLPVYYCNTDLDFPYEETIFQIARKKLLKILSL